MDFSVIFNYVSPQVLFMITLAIIGTLAYLKVSSDDRKAYELKEKKKVESKPQEKRKSNKVLFDISDDISLKPFDANTF